MADVAAILVDDLDVTGGDLDADDLREGFGMEKLAETRVGERDRRLLLWRLLHDARAEVGPVRRGIGAPAGRHPLRRTADDLLLQRLDIQRVYLTLPPEVMGLIRRTELPAGPTGPMQVCQLRDRGGRQVIAEEIGLVLAIRREDQRAVVLDPAGVRVVLDTSHNAGRTC